MKKRLISGLLLISGLFPVQAFADEEVQFRNFVPGKTHYEKAVELLQSEPDKYTELAMGSGLFFDKNFNYQFIKSNEQSANHDVENKIKALKGVTTTFGHTTPFSMVFYENKLALITININDLENPKQVITSLSERYKHHQDVGFFKYPTIFKGYESFCVGWRESFISTLITNTTTRSESDAINKCENLAIAIQEQVSFKNFDLGISQSRRSRVLIYRHLDLYHNLLRYGYVQEDKLRDKVNKGIADQAKGEL